METGIRPSRCCGRILIRIVLFVRVQSVRLVLRSFFRLLVALHLTGKNPEIEMNEQTRILILEITAFPPKISLPPL